MHYIVQLGSPNSPNGILSHIAISRTKKTAEMAIQNLEAKILITGGWGRFNESPLAHGEYVREKLVGEYKINPARIEPILLTHNTVEDAIFVRDKIASRDRIIVVTSDFHVPRTEYLFRCIFGRVMNIQFVGSVSDFLSVGERMEQEKHENQALMTLKAQGGVVWNGCLLRCPD
ncbi:YdcF family protein [Patescibacteria group bacterium]|nr:YdcF family protein [Patescibacteria group bacterium]MBU4443682.1 YdcF family protein [bacterium]